jgi:hypothetical protein
VKIVVDRQTVGADGVIAYARVREKLVWGAGDADRGPGTRPGARPRLVDDEAFAWEGDRDAGLRALDTQLVA